MPPKTKRSKKIQQTLQGLAEKGLHGKVFAEANKVKSNIADKPYYEEVKPLISCLEKQTEYWKEKRIPVEEKEKEIESLQEALEKKEEEKEELEEKLACVEQEKKEQVGQREEKLAKTTRRLQRVVRKLERSTDVLLATAPKHTRLETAERKQLDELLEEVGNLIPNSKTDKAEVSGFDVARSVAVRAYCMLRLWGMGKWKARERATAIVWASGHKHKSKKLLKSWIKGLEEKGEFSNNLRGQRQAQHSLLYVQDVRERVTEWCKSQRRVDPKGLREWVNKTLVPELAKADVGFQVRPISKGTARRWLHRVGYIRRRKSKGAYTDGHDAPATVLARIEYIKRLRMFEPLMQRLVAKDDGRIELVEPDLDSQVAKDAAEALGLDRPYVVVNVYHDEMTAKPADKGKEIWILLGDSALSPKSEGQGYMVSGFMTAEGLLTVPGDALVRDPSGNVIVDKEGNPVRRGSVTTEDGKVVEGASLFWQMGSKGDGYFSCDDLIKQLKDKFIPTFRARYPQDRYKGLVHFDNATSHTAFAKDALVANKITVTDGCKTTPVMRSTSWNDADGHVHEQRMQFDDGRTKGLVTILVDRGLLPKEAHTRKWRKHNKKATCDLCAERSAFDPDRESRVDCCIERMVASRPDFVAQKNRVTELLESEGFFVLYIPKFHPELNPIERVWSTVKAYLRMLDDLTFAQLKVNFDHALYRIPVQEIRSYIRKSMRFLSVYEFVRTGPLAELVVKRFRSHRTVSKSDLAVYAQELKDKLAEIESGTSHHDKCGTRKGADPAVLARAGIHRQGRG